VSAKNIFVTEDGCRLYKVGQRWYDHPNEEDADLSCDDKDGHPVDMWGQPYEGQFVEEGQP
jgi:hypothetical protein